MPVKRARMQSPLRHSLKESLGHNTAAIYGGTKRPTSAPRLRWLHEDEVGRSVPAHLITDVPSSTRHVPHPDKGRYKLETVAHGSGGKTYAAFVDTLKMREEMWISRSLPIEKGTLAAYDHEKDRPKCAGHSRCYLSLGGHVDVVFDTWMPPGSGSDGEHSATWRARSECGSRLTPRPSMPRRRSSRSTL